MASVNVPCSRRESSPMDISKLNSDPNFWGILMNMKPPGWVNPTTQKSESGNGEYNHYSMNYLDPAIYPKYASFQKFGGIMSLLGSSRKVFVVMMTAEKEKENAPRMDFYRKYWTGRSQAREIKENTHTWDWVKNQQADGGDWLKEYDTYYEYTHYLFSNGPGYGATVIEGYTKPIDGTYTRLDYLTKILRNIDNKNKGNNKPIVLRFERRDGTVTINSENLAMIFEITIMAINVGGSFFGYPGAGEILRPYADMLVKFAKNFDGKPLNAKTVIDLGVSVVAQFAPNYAEYGQKISNIYSAYDQGNYGAIATEIGASKYLANFAQNNPTTFKTLIDAEEIYKISQNGNVNYKDVSNILTAYNQTKTINQLANNHSTVKNDLTEQKATENSVFQQILTGLQINNSTLPYITNQNIDGVDSDISHGIIANPKNELTKKEHQALLNINANLPVNQSDILNKTIEGIINKTINDATKTNTKPQYDIPYAMPEANKTCIEDELNKNGIKTIRTRIVKRRFFATH